jgi:lipopolysaccharide export system protein LptC
VSSKPVQVKLLNGVIDSQRLEVKDAGDVVRFDGGVAMTVTLPPNGNSAEADKGVGAK